MLRCISLVVGLLLATLAWLARGDELLEVRADRPVAGPEQGYFHMGSAQAPDGHWIGINSRYLTFDGKPWLPVMGEFHYSRMPPEYWDEALAKMKSSGVDIVSTYVIWNHHEETPGRFVFTGDRDLRRFVDACARHGLYVVLRLGPWVHGEVRFGGIPDWVVRSTRTRSDDPAYLGYVRRYWQQVASQVQGRMFKDGGPVIAVQLENEYNLAGEGRGAGHIATLKQLARELGFDVPLYTVTGWDNTLYPRGEVVPVFGGYPDKPWARSGGRLPPAEPYVFRFTSRAGGDLGAQTRSRQVGDAVADRDHTPFLGAEFGGGVPSMYRRRPVITADDIAAMLTVQLGSGANLYGYYMYQGGRNPVGNTALEESTQIGGYNDLPLISYDFQAPLGEYGDQRPVVGKIRRVHAFLHAFGSELAPMVVHAPERLPQATDDLHTLRWSVRSQGDAGFLFVSNHVRQYPMAEHRDVRFAVSLPDGVLSFPRAPVRIPDGASFIWPFNLTLDGIRLDYATAQLMTRFGEGNDHWIVMFAAAHQPVALSFDAASAELVATRGQARTVDGHLLVDALEPGFDEALRLRSANGDLVHVLVLSEEVSAQTLVADFDGRTHLFVADADLHAEGADIVLETQARQASLRVFPAIDPARATQAGFRVSGRDGLFQRFDASVVQRSQAVPFRRLRDAQPMPALVIGGPLSDVQEPMPELYGRAAAWALQVPPAALLDARDAWLTIRFRGDVARLFAGAAMLDDQFYDGREWRIGLRRFADALTQPLTLTVLPLRADSPVYIEPSLRPVMAADSQLAELDEVRLNSEQELRLRGQAASAAPSSDPASDR